MSHFAGAFADCGCVGLILIGIGIDGGCVGLILIGIGIGIDGAGKKTAPDFAQAFPYVARVDVEARRHCAHCFQSLQ